DLEAPVLGIELRLVAGAVAKAPDAIGHEQDHRGKDDARDPEGDDEGRVDIAPVRSNRGPPPRAQHVEEDGSRYDNDKHDSDDHSFAFPHPTNTAGAGPGDYYPMIACQ